MFPVTVHVVAEVTLRLTLSEQVPDGLGPKEMPPLSVKVTG